MVILIFCDKNIPNNLNFLLSGTKKNFKIVKKYGSKIQFEFTRKNKNTSTLSSPRAKQFFKNKIQNIRSFQFSKSKRSAQIFDRNRYN